MKDLEKTIDHYRATEDAIDKTLANLDLLETLEREQRNNITDDPQEVVTQLSSLATQISSKKMELEMLSKRKTHLQKTIVEQQNVGFAELKAKRKAHKLGNANRAAEIIASDTSQMLRSHLLCLAHLQGHGLSTAVDALFKGHSDDYKAQESAARALDEYKPEPERPNSLFESQDIAREYEYEKEQMQDEFISV